MHMKTLLLCLLFSVPAFSAPRTVTVQGEGEIKVQPDSALVQLALVSKAKEAKTAQAKNAKEMERVKKVLVSDFHLNERDLQTSNFSLQADYNYGQNGKQHFLGFRVEHHLQARVKKLSDLGGILDQLVGQGGEDQAVLFQGVSFETSKRKEIEVQALELAMKNAEERAQVLAKSGNRKIKGVERISDGTPLPVRTMDVMSLAQSKSMAGAATQISGGELSVQSQVSVEYEME